MSPCLPSKFRPARGPRVYRTFPAPICPPEQRVELIDRVLQNNRPHVAVFQSLGGVFPDWWDSLAAMEGRCPTSGPARSCPRRGLFSTLGFAPVSVIHGH